MEINEATEIIREFGKHTSRSYEIVTGQKFDSDDMPLNYLATGLCAYIALDWANKVDQSNIDEAYNCLVDSLERMVLDMIRNDNHIIFE